MNNGRKNSLNHGSALILKTLILLLTCATITSYSTAPRFCNILTAYQDTTKPALGKVDTIPGHKDSTINKSDTFHLKLSKDSLSAPVHYSASDSMVFLVPEKKIVLFGKGDVKYTDVHLTADSIEIDQDTKMVTATFRRDSLGRMIGKPVMEQTDTKMFADVIKYNFETQKGLTQYTMTMQGDMNVQAEKLKRYDSSTYYGLHGLITTCNYDTPHFAFRTTRMKLINKKLAVTGPIHPEFEGVPIPIYLPFGFFPLSQGRHSGLLPPQFTASDQFGLGLEGLGYYKVLNDNFDITTRANIYSYGGYSLFLTPTYRVRYRYNGSLNLAYQYSRVLSNDPKQEFQTTKTFNITWAHSVDSRARPGTTFSASVNAGSTKFNQFVYNNPVANYTNNLSSSINYSKTWGSQYNLTISANHNQNSVTGLYNLNLPTAAFTVNTFYPFQKKDFVGTPKWYEKLGIGLSTNVANQMSFLEKEFSLKKLLDTLQWGAQHSIPIALSLPPLGPLQIGPGISFGQKWYSQKLTRRWDSAANKLDTSITKGFYLTNDVSFSLSLSTALFGTFTKFGKNSWLQGIHHTIRPTISLSYKPDLASNDFYTTKIDSFGHTTRFSYFDGTIYGPFGEGQFGGISFGLDNNLEAKIKSKTDTSGIKKIKLIDGFGFNGSYNLIADSFKLSDISLYLRSSLFDKINITAGATLDPYQVDSLGYRKKEYAWQGRSFGLSSLGRIINGNIAISTSFQSKAKDKDKEKAKQQAANEQNQNLPPMTPEEQMAQMNYVRSNPAEFADFNIPWTLSLSFSLNFSKSFSPDFKGFTTTTTASFNWNGDFNLTPKWKVGMNGFYDVKASMVQQLSLYISREMHCWQMSINITPVGLYRTFNITISPKSGILRDLRINRTRYFYGA